MDKQVQSFHLSPAPDKNHYKRVILYLAGILLLMFLAGGIVYVWSNNNQQNISIQNPKVVQVVSPSIDPLNKGVFVSQSLGISFSYLKKWNNIIYSTKVIGNKIYVTDGTYNQYDSAHEPNGQYVQVFQKNPKDSLQQGVEKQFLIGYPSNCYVKTQNFFQAPASYPSNFAIGVLAYKGPNGQDVFPSYGDNGIVDPTHCPRDYFPYDHNIYFLEDKNHPGILLIIELGNGTVIPSGENPDLGWNQTIKVLH